MLKTKNGTLSWNWHDRETGPDDGDPWRPVTMYFDERPTSGQTFYPEDPMFGGGGVDGGDPVIVGASGEDANGFPERLVAEWNVSGGRKRQTYLPSGLSAGGWPA